MVSRFTMIPASQAATSRPPKRGATATTTPATTSTTPTAYMACCAVPGTIPSTQGAKYRGQSTSRLANLSSPNRTGASVNAARRSRNAWWAGSDGNARPAGRAPDTSVAMTRSFYRQLSLTLEPGPKFSQPKWVLEMDDVSQPEGHISAVAALDEPTRRRLYDFVVRRPAPVSRDEAAEAVGVPRTTVAFHLDRL